MRARGLTLIELLATLAVVAVIMLAGTPALHNLLLDQRMTTQINDFVHSAFLAKQSAHTRQTETVICKSPTGRHCEPGAAWGDGWLVFANQDQDYPATVDANEPVLAVGPSTPIAGNSSSALSRFDQPTARSSSAMHAAQNTPGPSLSAIREGPGSPLPALAETPCNVLHYNNLRDFFNRLHEQTDRLSGQDARQA